MVKFIIWLAEVLIGWLRKQNNILADELEESVKRNKEHEANLAEQELIRKDYEDKISGVNTQLRVLHQQITNNLDLLEAIRTKRDESLQKYKEELSQLSDKDLVRQEL